jgi:Flp pilus assembly protein TadB
MDAPNGLGMLIAVTIVAIAVIVRAVRRRHVRQLEQDRLNALIETADLLLAMTRAGFSLPQAVMKLADIAPDLVRGEFITVRDAVDSGVALTAALAGIRRDLGSPFEALIALVISALRLGVPTETFIVQLHVHARHAHRQHGEALARALPVRLAMPLVVCTLPSFIVLIIVPVVAGTLEQLQLHGGTP